MTLSLSDGWNDEDTPLRVRFGVRTRNADSQFAIEFWVTVDRADTTDEISWLPASLSSSTTVILPFALPLPRAACGRRTAYDVHVEVTAFSAKLTMFIGTLNCAQVCDQLSACTTARSAPFSVSRSANASDVIAALLQVYGRSGGTVDRRYGGSGVR